MRLCRRRGRRGVGRRGLVRRRPELLRGAARVRVLRGPGDAVVRLGLQAVVQQQRSLVCQPETRGEMRMRGGVGIGLDLRTRTFMFGLGVCSAAAGFCERHQIMAVRARVHFRLRFYI